MAENPTPDEDPGTQLPDAWNDGRLTGGKHYVLQTTEGQEIVSEASLRGARGSSQGGVSKAQHAALAKKVDALSERLDQLQADKTPEK